MKLAAVLIAALALLGGFAGALRAYSVAAPAQTGPAPISIPHYVKVMPVKPGVTFRWAACRKPAVRKGRACVTEVNRTVTLPAPVLTAPPAAVRVAAPPAHRTLSTRHRALAAQPTPAHDDGGHHGGEDHGRDD